jgi:signal transduction histidine kinase
MHYMVDGEDIVVYSASYQSADGRLFRVEAGATLYRMQQTLHFLTKLLSLITIVILLLAASGGYLLMGRPLQPLAVLSEKAAKIGRSRLGERLPVVHTGDELEQLTHSLNGMIDRLEAALDHNRRFSADASHELRTPLMVMHSDIEEILQNEDQPSQTIDNLVSTLEEIKRMTRIVNSLMAITRLDAGGEQMRKEVFDLAALARTATDQMRIVAEEKGLTVSCGCKDSVYIHADHMHIKQVLINLIDNAIKYTPARETLEGERFSDEPPVEFEVVKPETENPSVTVSVFASESHAQLKIADHGIGIPAEGLPFVFDRFYRTDFARSRGAGGVGLGLAIVKAIVTAHEGTVAITSVLSVGSVVTVTLPLATRPLLAADSQSIEEMNRSRRQLTAR